MSNTKKTFRHAKFPKISEISITYRLFKNKKMAKK